ncbi:MULTISPECIES: phage tail sheath subtilisin-like domain-containing protein [unclassified Neisseria]|uniref:phage tail sheath subtilisin-like domain-containing protein n=1 Tax=unclassified Neisseria TaxID=2623750 RepID=UPI0026667975|nr:MULTISPECIES: phage tail sheath subtilisin-like domain-containing protein [unclassified Neisseria]MDO1509942.1 phage tail sheath subtilisin-like domain-containing protein [Neisseria sp. MVDL19-042950]MDO1516141.1 phage tail sheath subtilisin-like domain-containing protein [Neisseria sp. MVDL18-041461]MDO1563256.1 phage tail sheath subtilisin-like domain-containing protein [Neisseria sp. MVDL20-010259]
MPHIDFDTIPGSIRVPGQYIEFNTRNAVQGLPQNPQKVLMLAPILAGGRQPALKPVQMFSDAEAAEMFGKGSLAHLMVRQAFMNNPYLDLTVIGLADHESGIAATSTVTLAGTATAPGVVELTIGGMNVSTAVSTGETAAVVAARLKTVIDAADVTVTAAVNTAAITLTAKHKGEIGNETAVAAGTGSTGLTYQIAKGVSGAKNPDIAAAVTKVAGKHYHIICSAFSDGANAKALSDHITAVSNAIEQRGCIGVLGLGTTLSTATTAAGKINDGRITAAWYKGAAEQNGIIAAGYAAVLAFEEDPAKPLNTLEIKGLNITPDVQWPLFAECNNALYNGITPLTVVNNRVQIMRAVSTYTKSANNTDDPALLDITTIRTLDYVRRSVKERIALRFPRDKLSDRLLPKVKSEILDVLIKLDQAEIIENAEANKGKLVVARAQNDPNRVNAIIPADVVNGLHVFAGRIDLIL